MCNPSASPAATARPPTTRRSRGSPVSRFAALVGLAAGLLGGCAAPEAERFINRYGVQPNVGPLYELSAQGRTVGWLYGAVHYGIPERPSMSQAAARAIAQTRHVYLEQTDRFGTSWPMHTALEQDIGAITSAKAKAARVSAEKMRQGLIAAKKLEKESGGVALVLASDPAYHEHWVLANNYCGAFYEYGTERLALAFATGKDIIIHSLETEATKQAALAGARDERCRQNRTDTPPPAPVDLATVSIDAMCRMILHDISRDQSEGRPNFLTAAAVCVANSRHQTMAARISAAVKAGEKPFVIVGRGHLMPEQNLVALLAEQGLTLRRID